MKKINKKLLIGLDIGATKINVILAKDAQVLYQDKQLTQSKSLRSFLVQLENIISNAFAKSKEEAFGIGLAVAGALDLKNGKVLNSTNLSIINGLAIKKWLENKFKLPVMIDNDARCFTRAEYLWGRGQGYKNIVGITLGSGIGGGIMIDGKMIYGAHDSAGEIGHTIINSKFESRNSKLTIESFEDLASVKFFKKSGFSNSYQVFELAKKGDKKAKTVFERFGQNLGIGLSNIINMLDPEVIILGGGLSNAAKFFLASTKKTINHLVISPKAKKSIRVLIPKLGDNASALGATALFKIYEPK